MKRILLFMLISFLGLSFQALAQGNLLITPKRVVFEGNKQKEELNLVNIGKDTATYSISFVQKNMKENGSFVNIDAPDSGQMFAEPYLRIFPRQVILAPGEPQVIMLQCRRMPDMLSGEYRSHLYFRSEKDYTPMGMKNSANDTTLLNVQLMPIFGISIPIIIRSGAVNVTATLSDLKLETQPEAIQYLKLIINRTGNISLYGNLTVDYIPVQGKPYQVAAVNGVGVYTNINKRNVSIKLNQTPSMAFKNGKLKVRYTSRPDDSKYVVYATGDLEIK